MSTTIQLLRSDIFQQRPDPGVLANGTPMVNLFEGEPGLFFSARDGSLFKVGPASVGALPPNSSPQGYPGNSLGELWVDTSGTAPNLKFFDGSAFVSAFTAPPSVSSVGLSFSDLFSVTGSPVTTSGTLAATLVQQPANRVFAGPPSIPAGTPSFRALVEADLPSISASKVTSGVFDSGRIPSLDASKIVSGVFQQSRIPSLDASTILFAQSSLGAVTRSVEAKLSDLVSVKDFGAIGDGSNDDTNAIQAALASGAKLVYFPAGNYKITSTLTVTTDGQGLVGDGIGLGQGVGADDGTAIIHYGSGPVIFVSYNLTGVSIRNFNITRANSPVALGDDGIAFDVLTEQAIIDNVQVRGCWVGLQLCATSYSFVTQCIVRDNYSHGIRIANGSGINGLQWQFLKNLTQTNDGYGLLVDTAAGSGPASVGDIIMTVTYANRLGGMWFEGTAASPINAIRMHNCFIGEDGDHGLYLNTYNTSTHKIDGTFVEIIGTAPCGRNQITPATNVGNGIHVTADNGPLVITNCVVLQNSHTGIVISASRYLISGCEIRLNGNAGDANEMDGIFSAANSANTRGSISSCSIKGHTDYAIRTNGDNLHVASNDLRENVGGGFFSSAGYANSTIIGNQGISTINITSSLDRNGVQVLGARETGWTAMTGTGDKASSFDTSTVTLADLAERVKALQDALTTHGLIGA